MFYLVIETEPATFKRSTSLVKMFDIIQQTDDNWLLSNEPCFDDDDQPMTDEMFELV